MGAVKIIIVLSCVMAGFAVLFTLDMFAETRSQMLQHLPESWRRALNDVIGKGGVVKDKLFTKEELSSYDGKEGSKGLYLAILGKVYDVSKGARHYGPDGGYGFFAAKDGTKAFITGEFNEKGLVDNVDGLTNRQMMDLLDWKKLYDKDYVYKGILVGNFYDTNGEPTDALKDFHKGVAEGEKEKAAQKADEALYPPCNSEWSQARGGRVYCSNRSGGIARDWVGVPRQYHKAGGKGSPRCACIRTTGPPTDDPTSKSNRGDLDNPNFKLYKGCNPKDISCDIID